MMIAATTVSDGITNAVFNSSTSNSPITTATAAAADTESVGLIIVGVTAIVVGLALATLKYAVDIYREPERRKRRRAEALRQLKLKQHRMLNWSQPIPIVEFLAEFQRKQRKGILSLEFKALQQCQLKIPVTPMALHNCNSNKNFSPVILPYKKNAVKLDYIPCNNCDSSCTTYVNASWIDSYSETQKYIAAQGPMRSTKYDFWRMIWQHQVACIVMTTNLFECTQQQCEKYWHSSHARFHDIDVWLLNEYRTHHYVTRLFCIAKKGGSQRQVRQFEFNSWEERHPPPVPAVMEVRRKVKQWMLGRVGHVLVHCSNGSNRSCAYIAIDSLLHKVQNNRTIDIVQVSCSLRRLRAGAIGNQEQFDFLYAVARYCIINNLAPMSMAELGNRVANLGCRDRNGRSGYEAEFHKLSSLLPEISPSDCAAGHRAENFHKSRNSMLQPPERARPYLTSYDSVFTTDFINAVFVDGHMRSKQYIVTQWPMKQTINDFWKLLYDHHVTVVVVLSEWNSNSRNYPRFWPSAKSQEVSFGSVQAMLQTETEINRHILMQLHAITKVNNNGDSSVKCLLKWQIAFLFMRNWPNSQPNPATNAGLLQLSCLAQEANVKLGADSPILVLSNDGAERCGLCCSLLICLDRMRFEQEVDVFQAAELVKQNRTQMIASLLEYKLLYDVVNEAAEQHGGIQQARRDIAQGLQFPSLPTFQSTL